MKTLLLIAPAEDAKSAVVITEEQAAVIRAMAERLGLKCTDQGATADGPAKLYVARPASKPAPKPQDNGQGVYYPSGAYLARHPENNSAKYAPGNPDTAAPLVAGNPETKLSRHFKLGEFAPKSSEYDGVRVHPDLIEALEEIRGRVGGTVHVTSGYRPPAYNAGVGGVPNSQHLDGLAADIYTDGSLATLHRICESVIGGGGGVGYYPRHGFVHIDVRGYRARWTG